MRVCLLILLLASLCAADVPVDCRFEDVIGTWEFTESDRNHGTSLDCPEVGEILFTKFFTFSYPNLVTDEIGNVGTWTLVSNQGFEVRNNNLHW